MMSKDKQNPSKEAIWAAVAAIPLGRVATYGDVAKSAGLPNYARYVGQVLKGLPEDSKLPWHRVVNAKGRISFSPGSKQAQRQENLLVEEGVVLKNGKLKLKLYRANVD